MDEKNGKPECQKDVTRNGNKMKGQKQQSEPNRIENLIDDQLNKCLYFDTSA